MRLLVVALIFVFAFVALPARAAGVHRCIGAHGDAIFTDQPCEDIGAVVRPEPVPAFGATNPQRVHAHDCARTVDDLRRGLEAALAAHDVNRIAGFYQWAGIGSEESALLLKRLQEIANRPLTAVNLIHSRRPVDASGFQTVASTRTSEASAIELVQTRSDNDPTPARTGFALSRYMDCWWVRF